MHYTKAERCADEYSSNPKYPEPGTKPSGGNAEALMKYCIAGTTKRELKAYLNAPPPETVPNPAEVMAQGLAHYIRIPRAQILMGFTHLKEAQAGR